MAKAKSCDLAPFLRTKGLSHQGRAYMAVGVQVARYVERKRSSFDVDDIPLKRLPGIAPNVMRTYASEFLATMEATNGKAPSWAAFGTAMVAERCTKLNSKVRKYWKGY